MSPAADGYSHTMEPIQETAEAVETFGPLIDGEDLLGLLQEMGQRVQEIAPDCVGLSLASREHGVTFTLVASDELIAALDGVQYVSDGPCVTSVEAARVIAARGEEMLGEARWHLFAQATAAAAITSTLTLPIMVAGQATGSVNLYASSPDAFDGHHEALATIFDAWAPGAVTNADLGFTTRRTAEQAPRLLYEEMRINIAIGVLIADQKISLEEARERLVDAARRAGVTQFALAQIVIAGLEGPNQQ